MGTHSTVCVPNSVIVRPATANVSRPDGRSPICFKKPKMPEKSREDIAAEKELEEQMAARKRELAEQRRGTKQEQTEEDIARAMGLFGMRSLIAGPKGGMGFGRSFRSVLPVAGRGGGGSRPSAPPIAGGSSGGGATLLPGASSGGVGGSPRRTYGSIENAR